MSASVGRPNTGSGSWKPWVAVLAVLVVVSLAMNAWLVFAPASAPAVPGSIQSELNTDEGQLATLDAEVANITSAVGNGTSNGSFSELAALVAVRAQVSSLSLNLTNLQTAVDQYSSDASNEAATLQMEITGVESQLSSLNLDLNVATQLIYSLVPVTLQVNIYPFTQNGPGPVTGDDWLIDESAVGSGGCYNVGRTPESRYVTPEWIDLNFNRTCLGQSFTINLYAYWHSDDSLIDIDPVFEGTDSCVPILGVTEPREAGPDCALDISGYVLGSAPMNGDAVGVNGPLVSSPVTGYVGNLTWSVETLGL
jgi:hypothetical protein